jgi:dipeptidyl aminopeptidase/acylaminoacyl peptidase
MMTRVIALCALTVACVLGPSAKGQSFTLEQALSAPFASELVASQKTGSLAWVENEQGKRNLWIATRDGLGKYASRRLTSYDQDDGQEMYQVAWTPSGDHVIYVRGGDSEFPGRPDPNPALIPEGVSQSIWLIASAGGEPRKLGDGYNPVVSPAGDQIAFILHGQIWTANLGSDDLGSDAGKAKPLLHTRGDLSELVWAPDAHALVFVSERTDHSFVGVYNLREKTLNYLDPSTENDSEPLWSPDSQQVAFVRVPGSPQPPPSDHRTASPWSIRVADASTGRGHLVWKATDGQGSAFHEIPGDQLLWTADNNLIFPWEADGWSHLYSVPASGGTAQLLTPGPFEVEDMSLTADRKNVLYASNQGDIDRRHIWTVAPGGGRPRALTSGTGIEANPVQAGQVVATLRSDERTPLRPALLEQDGSLQDLAPELVPKAYPGARFVKPEQVLFPAEDGLQLHGQLFLSTGDHDGKRHPALVFFHGGSRREMLLGFHTMQYYSNAYAMNQYLASLGYIVISVNYRSGIGYGVDFREALHYGRGGASEFNDVLGAGNYLRGRSDVDGARIGAWGGSYGGFLTALALARASNIFAAGVDMHGVHEWQRSANWRPSHDADADAQTVKTAWESSPIASIATWRSPVLLIQGDDDRNVPFSQTVSLARALRKQGVPFEELVFPDEIHGFLLHRHWIEAYKAEAEFFQRHLMSPEHDKQGNK